LFALALQADGEELLTLGLADHLLDVVAGEQLASKRSRWPAAQIREHLKDNLTLANGL